MTSLSRLASAGRFLQALGALVLQAAPFLLWVQFPLFGMTLGMPGIFLHGAPVLGIGLFSAGLMLLRQRQPGLQIVLAACAAWFTHADMRLVMERTEYHFAKLQLSLTGLNETLGKLGQDRIELMPSGWAPADYVGFGIWVAYGGCVLLVIGALLEVAGHAWGKKAWSVLIGWPLCRACGKRTGWDMQFCPGCGRNQRPGRACGACGRWLEADHGFCAGCGQRAVPADM